MERYEISSEPSRLDIRAMHAFLTRSYWSTGIPFETVERAARNSLCFGAYEVRSGAQVGLARVVTDFATFAYLCDVYVLPGHRERGLARRMLQEVMAHPALTGARRAILGTRDAHDLYRKFGFRDARGSPVLMEIVRQDMYPELPTPSG